ncbi:MAG TPA: glycosyltransferase family 39 protein, partial [Candidatus Dormibacteraeota bacterium]|nr:glycosyltransferase family 39 protein [Candidatus Dormibacteraeota bacterium]
MKRAYWQLGLLAVLLLALALRLHGIHNPLLDHPGWRQGDTASIARNFARIRFDIIYPQTSYNGPPPNYVELELQIVPFLAASLYKLFGIHEIFGRLITLAFSLATVVSLAYFGRWIFESAAAGLIAAFLYAVFPGSVYYGRTFMPDSAMVFFLTIALYATARYLVAERRLSPRGLAGTTALLALAYLAKPVAAIAVVPVLGMIGERVAARRSMPAPFALILV